jgi:hypothetical protein
VALSGVPERSTPSRALKLVLVEAPVAAAAVAPLPLPPLPLLAELLASLSGGPRLSAMLPEVVAVAAAATGLPLLPGRPLRPLERVRDSGRRALLLLRSAGEVRRSQASDTAVNDISGVSACDVDNKVCHCQRTK